MTLTKKELMQRISEETALPKAQVERVVSLFTQYVTQGLQGGQKVFVSRLGTFSLRRRGPRTARNPKTGALLSVPAVTFPTFSFSRSVREAVRDTLPHGQGSLEETEEQEAQHHSQQQLQYQQQKKRDSKLFGWLP